VLILAGLIALNLFVEAVEYATSPRKGEQLLWLSPQGIGVQHHADAKALHLRLAGIGVFVVTFGSVAYGAYWYAGRPIMQLLSRLDWRQHLAIWTFAVIVVAVSSWFQRIKRPKIAQRRKGTMPDLLAWDGLDRIEIARLRNGLYRLRAWQHFTKPQKQERTPVTQVRFALSAAAAAELKKRVRECEAAE